MARKILLNIVLISMAITLISSAISTIIFSSGSEINMEDKYWKELYNMSYKEAMDYMGKHSTKLSGSDILKKSFSLPQDIFLYLKRNLWFFITIFITGLITAFRVLRLSRHALDNVD